MKADRRRVIGILILVFAVAAVLATAGCVSESTVPQQTIQEKNNISWYNYDITDSPLYDTVDHTFAAKDNFYAYANAESLKNINTSESIEGSAKLSGMLDSVIEDKSYTGTEAELVRTTFAMFRDTDTRDKLGVTPVLPAVEEIRSVSTLDELSELISSGGTSSLKEAFVRERPTGSATDGTVTVLNIVPAEFVLTDPTVYQNMTTENAVLYSYLLGNFQKFLVNCGYTDEEAGHMAEELKKMEAELAPLCYSLNAEFTDPDYCTKTNHPYTYEQFSSMAFPIAGDLKDYHDAGVTRYVVESPAWLDKLNELYTPENIDGFKAVMLYNLFITATPFLDTETQKQFFNSQFFTNYPTIWHALVQAFEESGVTDTAAMSGPLEVVMKFTGNSMVESSIKNDYLGMAVGKVLTDAYVPEGTKEKYRALTDEIIATFGERVKNADWLSDTTKNAALDKLSKVKVRVLYPDDWSYYSYDDVNYRDADNLYDLSVELRKHNQAAVVKDALQEPSAAVWPRFLNMSLVPQVYNACYNKRDNSINILYGFFADLISNPDASEEEILAIAGTTIGHELTHGFDSLGSRFDGYGASVNWWTDSDRKNFDTKLKKIADYYSGFEARPGEYLKGENVTDEAAADLGGLSTVLDIARTKENFDYDKFFTTYGRIFYQPVPNASYETYLNDLHPQGMYRVNVGVQQYDEFNRTYNVTEGDQMYLAPENRITIW